MRSSKKIAFALAGLISLLPLSASAVIPDPVVIPSGVAPIIKGTGTGLCIASRIAPNGIGDIGPVSAGSYVSDLNSFMEAPSGPPINLPSRIESVVQTVLDLSNNNPSATNVSFGDFTNAMAPMCKIGGCDFIVNDTVQTFGARLRGFLNVTPDLTGVPVHIGFYTDDAVSLTFYGKSGAIYPVVLQQPVLGKPTWRLTNAVVFQESGLYPLEILYLEIAEHAAMEMSFFKGNFTDFQLPANQAPVTKLSDVGFTLFAPSSFSQTISGNPSYPDPAQCKQCERQFVNLPGNNGCDPGYYCNEAALCGPCDSALLCGPTCSPCGGVSPFCINSNGKLECGGCRDDFDCKEGYRCDPEKHVCQECNLDDECDRGKACIDHTCQWCPNPTNAGVGEVGCAGSSCNCCPKGLNLKPMQCVPLDKDGPPVCVECTTNGDCSKGVCDVLIGMCVDSLATNERTDCCGEGCAKCPIQPCTDDKQCGTGSLCNALTHVCDTSYPFCLPGPLGTACAQCRSDMDCVDGKFCLSGQCEACVKDKRCGKRCESCGGEQPFCLGTQLAESAICVRCTEDSQCEGSSCDPTTHMCRATCEMSCAATAPYCDGKTCVQCYADTQCPCGGTCNLDDHTCSSSCKTNGDCNGDQHCRWKDDANSKECAPGPMPDDAGCGGTLASACQGSIGSKGEDQVPVTGVIALSILAFVSRRSKRGKS